MLFVHVHPWVQMGDLILERRFIRPCNHYLGDPAEDFLYRLRLRMEQAGGREPRPRTNRPSPLWQVSSAESLEEEGQQRPEDMHF